MGKKPKPIFQDPPKDVEEDWSGFVIGGMAQTDELSLARSYKLAADAVAARALRLSDLSYELAYPALYLYRHALELYLKLIVQPVTPTHGIAKLAGQFEAIVRSKLQQQLPDWVMDRLREFADIDPESQAFRYTKDRKGQQMQVPGEWWVSFRHLRRTMNGLVDGFEKAYLALGQERRKQ